MKSGKLVENQDKQNRVPAKPKIEQTEASQSISPPTVESPLSPQAVLGMQQVVGNQAVQRAIAQRRGGSGPQEVDDQIASRIQSITNSGGGSSLSSKTEEDVSNATGVDVSQANIRVHEGDEVDSLNESIGAKAFTLGNNIFMGSASKGDRDVEIHESVHAGIHQQSSSLQSGQASSMTVNDPEDKFEHHADKVVEQVKSNEGSSSKPDGGASALQRIEEEESVQMMEEEEESVQMMEEEEESLQMMEEEESALVEQEA